MRKREAYKSICITLDADLCEQITKTRKEYNMTRSECIEWLLKQALENLPDFEGMERELREQCPDYFDNLMKYICSRM